MKKESSKIEDSSRREGLGSLLDVEKAALYTIEELSPLLRTTDRTLRRYCSEGIFSNAKKLGGKNWLIPGYDVLKLFPHVEGLKDEL